MKFISVPIFILSLAIGLFVVYITAPKAQVIYVYPNPDNEDKVTFQDITYYLGSCVYSSFFFRKMNYLKSSRKMRLRI